MTPGTIFISHRAEYGNLVRELKKAIEATSRGRIAVFISEELRGADNWREAINSQLMGAESLFLVYGAPYEDWSWCFYEAGYFAGIDAGQKQSRRIYCISRPNIPAPGPLSELQMVTDIDGLLNDLIDIYDRNKVSYNPVQLRQSICRSRKRPLPAARGIHGLFPSILRRQRWRFQRSDRFPRRRCAQGRQGGADPAFWDRQGCSLVG